MTQIADIKPVFIVNGQQFDSKAEAVAFVRRPKVLESLGKIADMNDELANWLIDNQESIETSFETGTIQRVTKAETAKLTKALAAIAEANDPAFAFVVDNIPAILGSFRWPTVKRMSDAEKKVAIVNSLLAIPGVDENMSSWILENKTAIFEGYSAGVEKREVSEAAATGLALYRAQQAEKKQIKLTAQAAAREEKLAADPAHVFVLADFYDKEEFSAYKATLAAAE